MKNVTELIERIGTIRGLQVFQVLRFASFFLTGILLSKSFLTVSEIGSFENVLFISGAVSFFWISGMLNALLGKFHQSSTPDTGLLYNTAAIIYSFNSLLVIVMLIFQDFFRSLMPVSETDYYPALLLYIFFNNPTFINEYVLLLRNKPLHLVIYGVSTFVVQLISVILPLYITGELMYSFYGLIVFAILKNFVLIYQLRQTGKSTLQISQWPEIFFQAAPLMFSLLIAGSAEYIDGFLISTHFGTDAFAVFRYGAKELPVSLLMANALSMAIVPKLAADGIGENSLGLLRKETTRLMHLLFPLTLILLATSHYLYPIVFRPEFSISADVFNVYLLLVISRMLFPQSIIMAANQTGIIFKTSLIEIFTNVTASYLLMLKFGIMGVAYGTVIAFLTEKIILLLYCHRVLKISPQRFLVLRTWGIYTVLLITVYYITLKIRHL